MKTQQTNLEQLTKEFGERLLSLRDGSMGIRGGIHMATRAVEGQPIVSFIGSDDSVDRYNEVIDQSGWDLTNFRRNPVIPDCHQYFSIACILGRAIRCEVKNGRLENDVEFALDNPLGKIAYDMAKAGFLPTQSVGFIPLEWKNGNKPGEPDRVYIKAELLEISLVVVPANPNASNIERAVKSGAVQRGDLKEAHELLKTLCNDGAEPKPDASAPGHGIDGAHLLQLLSATAATMRHV